MDLLKKNSNNKPAKHVKTTNCSNDARSDNSSKSMNDCHKTGRMEDSHKDR